MFPSSNGHHHHPPPAPSSANIPLNINTECGGPTKFIPVFVYTCWTNEDLLSCVDEERRRCLTISQATSDLQRYIYGISVVVLLLVIYGRASNRNLDENRPTALFKSRGTIEHRPFVILLNG